MSKEGTSTERCNTEELLAKLAQAESENESLRKINKTLVEEVKSRDEAVRRQDQGK